MQSNAPTLDGEKQKEQIGIDPPSAMYNIHCFLLLRDNNHHSKNHDPPHLWTISTDFFSRDNNHHGKIMTLLIYGQYPQKSHFFLLSDNLPKFPLRHPQSPAAKGRHVGGALM